MVDNSIVVELNEPQETPKITKGLNAMYEQLPPLPPDSEDLFNVEILQSYDIPADQSVQWAKNTFLQHPTLEYEDSYHFHFIKTPRDCQFEQ